MTTAPPVVDMLFVIDNSPSMTPESTAFGLSLSSFFEAVGEDMDIQMGMTTSSVHTDKGMTGGLDRGEKGLLLGDIAQNSPIDAERHLRQSHMAALQTSGQLARRQVRASLRSAPSRSRRQA